MKEVKKLGHEAWVKLLPRLVSKGRGSVSPVDDDAEVDEVEEDTCDVVKASDDDGEGEGDAEEGESDVEESVAETSRGGRRSTYCAGRSLLIPWSRIAAMAEAPSSVATTSPWQYIDSESKQSMAVRIDFDLAIALPRHVEPAASAS